MLGIADGDWWTHFVKTVCPQYGFLEKGSVFADAEILFRIKLAGQGPEPTAFAAAEYDWLDHMLPIYP